MPQQNNNRERIYIIQCISDIERQLDWGPAGNWSNFDFEKLSDEIRHKTGVYLSVTTLKRFMGRLKYAHDPSSTTLNTLAGFLGFDDWRNYMQQQKSLEDKAPAASGKKEQAPRKGRFSGYGYMASLIALFLLIIAGLSFRKNEIYDPEDFSFAADKVYAEGVPNSVVFTYDAEKAATDSVFIVQTWDIRRKTKVARTGRKHSAMYYYPGFFRTKLIVGDQIVGTHDLQVTSNGWLGLVEQADGPVYFKKEEITGEAGVKVDSALLARYNYTLSPEAPEVRFFHQGDLGDLSNDNFVFETELKNDYRGGNNSCQYVEVLIQCKDDIIIIPLCARACIGRAYLYAAGVERRSSNADLSGFGADLTHWTHLRVEANNKQLTFFVNGVVAESFAFPHAPTGIVGVQYRFNGPGAVKYAHFYKEEECLDLL